MSHEAAMYPHPALEAINIFGGEEAVRALSLISNREATAVDPEEQRLTRQREVLTAICGVDCQEEIDKLKPEHAGDFLEKVFQEYSERADARTNVRYQLAPVRAYIDGKSEAEIASLYDRAPQNLHVARQRMLTHVRAVIMMPKKTAVVRKEQLIPHNEAKLLTKIQDSPSIARPACESEDPELFFPNKGEANKVKDAKGVCLSCEAREVCLKWALDNDARFGVWGGLTERERRKLKRR